MVKAIIILFATLLSSSAMAWTMSEIIPGSEFLLGVSAGPTWASGNKAQTLTLQPDVVKTYTAASSGSTFTSGELFIGWQKPLIVMGQSLISQLGVVIEAAGNPELSGDVWEDADPDFNNYSYDYKITHTHVAIKGRLLAYSDWSIKPYISGSIGVGFNRAYDFIITPKSSGEVAAPAFGSNTTTTFVYTLGIGLQKSLNSHFQVAVGYEFADWGKTQLSPAGGQTVGQGLSQNHLYAQQVQLSLFYLG